MIKTYEPFELTLVTTNPYSNPYLNVNLSATFSSSGKTIVIDGFWDGGNTWKIRMAPTQAGKWSYVTNSNDPLLNGKTGDFEAIESDNKGFIKANPDYPYSFMYSEGSPFFWMGDTIWMDPGYQNFKQYIDTISANGYNNYHTVVTYKMVTNEGGLPFEPTSTTEKDYNRLRPNYFKEYDKRVFYANSKGVIPQLYFVWSQEFAKFSRSQFERYEKYLIARYAAYNVVWIIAAEYNEVAMLPEYEYHGNLIFNKDPYKHPISLHPSGKSSSTDFSGKAWLSYIMQQRGFDSPLSTNQYILNDRRFNKPVINGEAHYLYDGQITVDVWRKQNWLIAIAGGYFDTGYQQLFWAGYNNQPFDLNVPNNVIGMKQMKYLSSFFNKTTFWMMNPDNSLVNNGYALVNLGRDYLIYLPSGGSTTVNLSSASGTLYSEWYNPRTGTYHDKKTVIGGGSLTYNAPDTNDWVLHVYKCITPICNIDMKSFSP